jgi:hypothetical protein
MAHRSRSDFDNFDPSAAFGQEGSDEGRESEYAPRNTDARTTNRISRVSRAISRGDEVSYSNGDDDSSKEDDSMKRELKASRTHSTTQFASLMNGRPSKTGKDQKTTRAKSVLSIDSGNSGTSSFNGGAARSEIFTIELDCDEMLPEVFTKSDLQRKKDPFCWICDLEFKKFGANH